MSGYFACANVVWTDLVDLERIRAGHRSEGFRCPVQVCRDERPWA